MLLFPLVGLLFYVLKWKQKKRQSLGEPRLINKLTGNYSETKYLFKVVSIIVAIGLLIIAAANLRKPIKGNAGVTSGVDVMIALDVSNSMLAEDEKPTRLDKARQLIYELSNKLYNNRIGLVVFAGKAYLQMPITSDIAAVKMFVSNANPNLVNWQGTDIGNALTLCNNSLDTKEKKYKATILITDGEDQDTKALETAKELADMGLVVHTVGVGSIQGAPIMEGKTNDYKRDIDGKTIITKLNQDLLREIANSTGGTFHLLDNNTLVANEITQSLDAMEKKTIGGPSGYVNYYCYYFIFLAIALVLLIVEVFVAETKSRFGFNLFKTVLVHFLLLSNLPSVAQSNTNEIIKGNELYRKRDYKAAQAAYDKAIEKDNSNSAALFNKANSLFRQQQFQEAAKQMEALANNTKNPMLQAKAWYNKGVAEAKQQQMEQALESFKKSLILDNNDEAARENMQMVLNQLNKKKQTQNPQQNKNQPNPQQNKKQAEQQLNMLREEEKRLQKEIQQKKYNPTGANERDW